MSISTANNQFLVNNLATYCYSVVARVGDNTAYAACQAKTTFNSMILVMSRNGSIVRQFTWKANQLVSGVDMPYGIALNQQTGDIYVTGQVKNTTNGYVYASRLLNNGSVVWTQAYGTSGLENIGWNVQLFAVKNLITVTGQTKNDPLSFFGGMDGQVMSINASNGAQLNRIVIDLGIDDLIRSSVNQDDLNLVVAGSVWQSNQRQGFLASYAVPSSGIFTLRWQRTLFTNVLTEFNTVKFHRGYLYAGGTWNGYYTYDVTIASSINENATLVVRYGLDGTLDTSFFVYGQLGYDRVYDIQVDQSSNIVMSVGTTNPWLDDRWFFMTNMQTFSGGLYYGIFENQIGDNYAMIFTSLTMLDDRTVIGVGASNLLLNGNAFVLVNKDFTLVATTLAPYQASYLLTTTTTTTPMTTTTTTTTTPMITTTTTTTTSTTTNTTITTTTTTTTRTTTTSTIPTATTTTTSTIPITTTTSTISITPASTTIASTTITSTSSATFTPNVTSIGTSSLSTVLAQSSVTSQMLLSSYWNSTTSTLATTQYQMMVLNGSSTSAMMSSANDSSAVSSLTSSSGLVSTSQSISMSSSSQRTVRQQSTSYNGFLQFSEGSYLSNLGTSQGGAQTSSGNLDVQANQNQSQSMVGAYALIAGIAVIALIAIGATCFVMKRRMRTMSRKTNGSSLADQSTLSTMSHSVTHTGAYAGTQMQLPTLVASNIIAVPAFMLAQCGIDFRTSYLLTKGGVGSIYLAEVLNPSLQQRVPAGTKLLFKQISDSARGMSDNNRAIFLQELSIMYRFKDDPRFAYIYAYSEEPAGLLLRFYELGSMKDYIHGDSKMAYQFRYTKPQMLYLMKTLSQALFIMHSSGIVHLDIKPANILLDFDPHSEMLFSVLTDFGLSKIVDEQTLKVKAFQTGNIKGASLSYAAPEILHQFRNSTPIGHRIVSYFAADVYAGGVVLLEMLTRRNVWG
ncbi:hypothetical protein MP228_011617 [Amoeboaphelidium protococcarum]|nr:hypothetical protein MP228_011617 [Amoeboaphelidium protococcarum]